MSDFFGRLKSGAGKVAFEAEKVAKVNRAQSELAQLKKQADTLYAKLGEMVYENFTNGSGEAPDITSLCQNITDMKAQVAAKEAELQRINAEVYNPAAPAPAPAAPAPAYSAPVAPAAAAQGETRFCPNCGKEQPASTKFCTDCGFKMQ
jgi:hypothetical protein